MEKNTIFIYSLLVILNFGCDSFTNNNMATTADYGKIQGQQFDFKEELTPFVKNTNFTTSGYYNTSPLSDGQHFTTWNNGLGISIGLPPLGNISNYNFYEQYYKQEFTNLILTSEGDHGSNTLMTKSVNSIGVNYVYTQRAFGFGFDNTYQLSYKIFLKLTIVRISDGTIVETYFEELKSASKNLYYVDINLSTFTPSLSGVDVDIQLDVSTSNDHDIKYYRIVSTVPHTDGSFYKDVNTISGSVQTTSIDWSNSQQIFSLFAVNRDETVKLLSEVQYTP